MYPPEFTRGVRNTKNISVAPGYSIVSSMYISKLHSEANYHLKSIFNYSIILATVYTTLAFYVIKEIMLLLFEQSQNATSKHNIQQYHHTLFGINIQI